MRGEASDHNFSLRPAILRNLLELRNNSSELEFILKVNQGFINHVYRELKNNEFPISDKKLLQAILQHYGLFTQWLDLTDNPTIALYFALQDLMEGKLDHHSSEMGYVYLLVFQEDDKKQPGWYENDSQYLIDLREAVNSDVLRAHTQQAWVLGAKELFDIQKIIQHPDLIDFDYNRYCVLRIEFGKKKMASDLLISRHKPIFFSKYGFFPNDLDKMYRASMFKFAEILEYLSKENPDTVKLKARSFPDTIDDYIEYLKRGIYSYFFSRNQICEIVKFELNRWTFIQDEERKTIIRAYEKYLCSTDEG